MERPISLMNSRAALRLLLILCLAPVCAGTGGGHGGGHFGGGHFSGKGGGHAVGHVFRWLRGKSKNRAERHPPESAGASADAAHGQSAALPGIGALPTLPSTVIRPVLLKFTASALALGSASPRFRQRPRFWPYGFPRFRSSGCFFDGFNQECFFEPAWPLFFRSWGYGGGYFDSGFGEMDLGGAMEEPDQAASAGGISSPGDTDASSQPTPGPPAMIRGQDLDPRLFLLILHSGADHIVTDYWVADGYIEYVSGDGARSHIPVEALDLQATVVENRARGLAFVLRTAPSHNP